MFNYHFLAQRGESHSTITSLHFFFHLKFQNILRYDFSVSTCSKLIRIYARCFSIMTKKAPSLPEGKQVRANQCQQMWCNLNKAYKKRLSPQSEIKSKRKVSLKAWPEVSIHPGEFTHSNLHLNLQTFFVLIYNWAN